MEERPMIYDVFEVYISSKKKHVTWRVIHNLDEKVVRELFNAFVSHANQKYCTVEKFASHVRGKDKGVNKCYAVGRLIRFNGFSDKFLMDRVVAARSHNTRLEKLDELFEIFKPGELYSEGKIKDDNGVRVIEHIGSGIILPKAYANWEYAYEDDL